MREQRPDPGPQRPLRPSLRLWGSLWLLIAVIGAVDLGFGALLLAKSYQLPMRATHSGILQLLQTSTALELPAEIPLGTILVKEGEVVVAGAPLVAIDTTALAARMAEIDRGIKADMILRDCLLLGGLPAGGGSSPPAPGPGRLDADSWASILVAVKDCRADYDLAAQNLARIDTARQAVAAAMSLMRRELALLQATPLAGARALRARSVFALLRARSQLLIQDAALAIEAERSTTLALRDRLTRVREVARRIATARQQLAVLAHHLNAPALLAPKDGKILQVRAIPPGSSLAQATPVIEMAAIGAGPGQVQLTLSQAALDGLQPAEPIMLEIAGLGGKILRLRGIVVAGLPTSPGTPTVEGYLAGERGQDPAAAVPTAADDADLLIALDPESLDLLETAGAAQLARTGIAAEIVLYQDRQSLAAMLRAIWRREGMLL